MTSIHRRNARAGVAPSFAALAFALALIVPARAHAAPVLRMGAGGHITRAQDPFVPAGLPTPAPTPTAAAASAKPKVKPKPKRKPQKTVSSELKRLLRAHAITSSQYGTYNGDWNAALKTQRHLHGTPAKELEAVIENMHDIAVAGKLTSGRLPALFLTLGYNRQWWASGRVPSSGSYVEFTDSALVWEYYAGQGIELQVLATFGKADGLYTAGPSEYSQMQALLAQMIPLAVDRAGGPVWEYYFQFGGGKPPWTSAMSQGTGIEALTRAFLASHDPSYLQLAHGALGLFTARPPAGVRVSTPLGARYVQYSFTPGTSIINAFLQSLIGLYDYAQASRDPQAQQLFNAGNAEAEAEVPQFDTGAWSLYQPGVEDTLSYHELVTGFLDQLCARTDARAYCTTAQHFHDYLTEPPALTLLTTRIRHGRRATIRFRLSKVSHVGIVLVRGAQTVFQTSAGFSHGVHAFAIPALRRRGDYAVRLAATDLAGNFARISGTVQVN